MKIYIWKDDGAFTFGVDAKCSFPAAGPLKSRKACKQLARLMTSQSIEFVKGRPPRPVV